MIKFKLITCILTQPIAVNMISRLKEEKNIITANATHARGLSSKMGYTMQANEILTVLVEETRAEEIFEFLYIELNLNKPNQGIIYQEAISRSSAYSLPDL